MWLAAVGIPLYQYICDIKIDVDCLSWVLRRHSRVLRSMSINNGTNTTIFALHTIMLPYTLGTEVQQSQWVMHGARHY